MEAQRGVQNIEPQIMEDAGETQNMAVQNAQNIQAPDAVPSVPSHIIPGDPPHAKYDDRYQCKLSQYDKVFILV